MEIWRLLAHNHWFTLNLYGYRLRLCARCSGYILGFTTPLLVIDNTANPLGFLGSRFQLMTCFLLTLPLALDWVTQSWGLRESSNWLRMTTGILLGLDIFFFSRLNLTAGRTIFVIVALFVVLVGHFGKLKVIN